MGVADARQASRVVCLVVPGDDVMDMPRTCLAAGAFTVRLFDLLEGIFEGKGRAGELTKSSVSIVSDRGGDVDRRKLAFVLAGRVCDLCMGLRLRFVTLAGSSCTGDKDFSRSG